MLAIMSPGFGRDGLRRATGQRLVVQAVRLLGLKAHEGGETVGIRALQNLVRLHIKLLQLADGQVNAAQHGVFTHVADDVGELKRQPQRVCVLGGALVGLAKMRAATSPTMPATRWQ